MDLRFLALLGLVGAATADPASTPAPTPAGPCTLCLHGHCYVKTKFTDSYSIPNILNFAIDRNDDTLYYTDLYNSVWSINLEEKVMKQLRSNRNERSLAVDQSTRDLYIAADSNIIKYNPLTNQTVSIPIGDVHVVQLQFKDKLYVLGRNGRLYTLEESELIPVEPTKRIFVDHFVVDKRGDRYFTRLFNENFKYSAANDKYSKSYIDKEFVYATDKDGDIYFIDRENKFILVLDYSIDQFIVVGAFDPKAFNYLNMAVLFGKKDDVIFVDRDPGTTELELFYLMRTEHHCKVFPKIEKITQ